MTVRPQASALATARDVKLAHYERQWQSRLEVLERAAGAGLGMSDMVRHLLAEHGEPAGFIPHEILQFLPSVELGRWRVNPPAPSERLAVVDGRYAALPACQDETLLLDMVCRALEPSVDAVVEFGSGLGINLARLRLRRPELDVTWLACEPTASGRRAAETLFSRDPSARLETVAFDYTRPDLAFLHRFRRVVAFTSHSVEQVPVLGEAFYRPLLDAPVTACIHLEPVGWQRFTNLVTEVVALQQDRRRWLQELANCCYRLEDDQLSLNAARWAAAACYNTDLLRLVADAAGRGDIAITALGYDLIAINPFNPSSLIAWVRRPPASEPPHGEP